MPGSAPAIGLLARVVRQPAIRLEYRPGYDDALDVVAVHGVGGLIPLTTTARSLTEGTSR